MSEHETSRCHDTCAMHQSLERLAAAPRSQGIPSLRHPVSGETYTMDAAKAAALAAFAAEVARAPEPVAQEERASVARVHACAHMHALAAEQAYPGRDALGLGVKFTFDEVRDCLRGLKTHKDAGNDRIRRSSSNIRVAQGFRCSRTCLTLSLPPDAYPPRGVREWLSTYPKGATQGTALTTDPFRSFWLSTSCLRSSSRNASHVLCASTTSSTHFSPAEERSTLCRTCWQFCGSAPRLTRPRMPVFSMPQRHMTRYRTLCCSTASFSAALWVQCSPSWWHCTRRRPAGFVLGRPCPLPSRCSVGLRKVAHCPRCCMRSS